MWISSRYWLALCFSGVLCSWGCAPAAWHARAVDGIVLQPGRYLDKYYRSPNFDPAAAVYQVETIPVEQVEGIGQEQARTLFNEELIKAMTANGLRVNLEELAESQVKPKLTPEESKANRVKPKISLESPKMSPEQSTPTLILSGVVDRLIVASPTWRFFSGRGHADLQVFGEIRRGQEVVFAFQDGVTITPPVNPKHRPPLESDLIVRMVIRHFTANFLNELLLPPKNETQESTPAAAPSHR